MNKRSAITAGSRKAIAGGKSAAAQAAAPAPARAPEDQLELYRRIFACSADAIAIIAPDGHYLQQNEAHREMTGYTDEELQTRTPAIHLGEEAFARIAAELEAKGSYRGEHVSRSKSGMERAIELTAFTVRNGAGQAVCHVGIKRDIGERKRAENEIQARARQQAAVAEFGCQALSGTDIAHLMQSAVELLASAMPADVTLVFELQPGGKHLLLCAGHGCDPETIGTELLAVQGDWASGYALRRTEPVIIEDLATERRFAAPGLRRCGVVSGTYVVIEGRERPLGILGAHARTHRTFTVDDIHFLQSLANVLATVMQRKQDEEVLQRAEKLAMVGRMAAAVAHEINNPLESITNLLYLLETYPGLERKAKKYATMAHQELERVAHVARQTLSFYRETTSMVPVKLAEVLDSVVKLHARRMQVAGIQVTRRFEVNVEVPAFPAEMRQVFSNLILNALDACNSSGRLSLRVYEARDWRTTNRRGVRVVVADNGCGIAREHRPRIFEPFFTTKGDKGTGLGLWVTYGIVQKHGGRIRVRSSAQPGRSGTTFSVFLPSPLAKVHPEAA